MWRPVCCGAGSGLLYQRLLIGPETGKLLPVDVPCSKEGHSLVELAQFHMNGVSCRQTDEEEEGHSPGNGPEVDPRPVSQGLLTGI